MDGEADPVSGGCQKEEKGSCKDLMMDVDELEEADSDFEDCSNKGLYNADSGPTLVVRGIFVDY